LTPVRSRSRQLSHTRTQGFGPATNREAVGRGTSGKLAGKVALITGGSSGIGEAIALRFASEGAATAVVAGRNLRKAEAVADQIRQAGGIAAAFTADVTLPEQVARLIEEAQKALGPIDILVNSAGIHRFTPVGEPRTDDVDALLSINVKGTWLVVNAAVPGMIERRHGKIINLASVVGTIGSKGNAIYAATKAGVVLMTRSLAGDLAQHGINVNCIAPGNTETPLNLVMRNDPIFAPQLAARKARTPSGRTYSSPEDVTGIALLLASEDSRAMHGSCVVVDEGVSACL
jgi:NAD(P)-dependent dehydrogenase (short-subunit alcohol dehydrogenase family)